MAHSENTLAGNGPMIRVGPCSQGGRENKPVYRAKFRGFD